MISSASGGGKGELCLHQWFEAQAEKTPGAVAVVFEDQRINYRDLNLRANRLAHRLRRLGVGPDVLVALCLERGLDMVAGILGVLKAGGAYLPLDLAYPEDRLRFILEDAKTPVLLTQRSLLPSLPKQVDEVLCIDDDFSGEPDSVPFSRLMPDHLAYCIYTSGSTGRPKGVLITHRNVVRLFKSTEHLFGFGPGDVWSMFHSYAFDLSVFEMWGALLYGGRLVVVPYLVSRTPADFYKLLEREAVTVLNQTPSGFRQLLWAEASVPGKHLAALRYVIFGGEKLEMQVLRPWFDQHGDQQPRLINMYGITETTVHVTYRPVTSADVDRPSLIGPPIPDLDVRLLDENLQPVKDGRPGEICVAGPGLARGYLNRDELTADRFIIVEGTRFYRSGDLARRLPDGELEYIGRIDNQVKIRGHRIELGEIESVLHRHAAVRGAVAIARGERIAAYVVAGNTPPTVTELRNFLKLHLPEYMIPAVFMFLDVLPLTNNGKVDRRALPEPGKARPNLMQDYLAPETAAEAALAMIWSEVLNIWPIGVNDNFFELGGDSIRMIQVLALAQEKGMALTPALLFKTPTIRGLSGQAVSPAYDRPAVEPFSLISEEDLGHIPDDVVDAYPMSALQAGMHFHSEMKPASGIFHDVFSYRIGLPFVVSRLEEALQRLVDRHGILRTSFDFSRYSESTQLVHQDVSVKLGVEDLRSLDPSLRQGAVEGWIEIEKRQPFDCGNAPLVRFHVQHFGENEFQFFVSFYHAVLDGWSLAVLVSEIFHDYAAMLKGSCEAIEPPKTCYREFVALERNAVNSGENRRFWVEYLRGVSRQKLPRWPKSFIRGGIEQVQGPEVNFDAHILEGLRRLAGKAGVPLRTVLLAAHMRMIKALSGQGEVISGIVMNGRPEELDAERMLGLFLNVVLMRMDVGGCTWLELVRQTYEKERVLLPYRRYPLNEIRKYSTVGFTSFEAAFNYVNWHVFQTLREDLGMQFEEGHYFEANNFTLLANFTLDSSGSRLGLHFDYDPEQLAEPQIRRLGDYYSATLAAMAAHAEDNHEDFCPLTPAERKEQLVDWNATRTDYPRGKCVHQLFRDQAERTPGAVALVLDNERLTYGELDLRASQLADHLQSRGVGKDSLVGLCLERSLEMVVAMLGILKAGGAYVPLDPSYPRERIEWIIEDTGMKVLLTHSETKAGLPVEALDVICIDTCPMPTTGGGLLRPSVTPGDLAYVMYTSGSTGIPKGVAVPHRGIVRLIHGIDCITLDDSQVLLHLSPISFDASTFEVWGALLHGARCVLFPENELAPGPLGEAIQRHGVTTLWLTAAYYNAVVDESPRVLQGVRQLLIGGEALSADHVRRGFQQLPGIRIINGYGPTESTTFACCYQIPEDLAPDISSIPIGRPIGNTEVYILDAGFKPVPVGVAGELFIGGDGLAEGYLNRPELTAKNFIPHPFSDQPGARLYRTGDLAYYQPDGNIEFAGRRDCQVKIRGFRIELGEIEAVLLQHPGVREAVVLAREDQAGDKRLVGYIAGDNGRQPGIEELWNFLKQKLPGYMVPGTFVFLEEFPLNINGKIDRDGLPAPGHSRPSLEQVFEAPRNSVEEIVAKIWRQVLKIQKVGIHDNFFELGGHSLAAIQVISRMRDEFQMEIPLRILFDNPTVAGLVEYLNLE